MLPLMGMRMKGIYKGFKHTISQISCVVKEREMEIGHPTDVKHLAHIGWDGAAASSGTTAPTWMNEFKTGPDFASTSVGNIGSALSLWSSPAEHWPDLSESTRESDASKDVASSSSEYIPSINKKQKHKWNKPKSTSSPKSRSPSYSSPVSFRVTKSISCFIDSGSATKPSNATKLV